MKTIINKRWYFYVTLFCSMIAMGIFTWGDDPCLSLAIIIMGAIMIIGYFLIIPNRFSFDKNGITVYYTFGIKTYEKWENIKHIDDHHSRYACIPWCREYHIGYFPSKIPFITEAIIPKNKKTTYQIEKYFKKKY